MRNDGDFTSIISGSASLPSQLHLLLCHALLGTLVNKLIVPLLIRLNDVVPGSRLQKLTRIGVGLVRKIAHLELSGNQKWEEAEISVMAKRVIPGIDAAGYKLASLYSQGESLYSQTLVPRLQQLTDRYLSDENGERLRTSLRTFRTMVAGLYDHLLTGPHLLRGSSPFDIDFLNFHHLRGGPGMSALEGPTTFRERRMLLRKINLGRFMV